MSEQIEPVDQPVELTREENQQSLITASQINNIPDRARRAGYVLMLVRENMRLLKELNLARKALGLDPLPTIDNSTARIK